MSFLRISVPELFILAISAAMFAANPDFPALRAAELRVRAAVWGWVNAQVIGRSGRVSDSRDAANLAAEVDRTRKEIEIARAELRTLSLKVLENDALRALFLLPKRIEYRYVFGEVIGRSIRPTESRLTVRLTDETSPSGNVPSGAPVIAAALPDWMAVGQVMGVTGLQVDVMLLSDPRSRIGVASADTPSYGSALLIGGGMDRIFLDYAAHPHFINALAPGVRLVTSPESRFPPGLVVAHLIPSGVNADGSLKLRPIPLASIGDIRFVVILASQSETP